ncbi:MAG: ABC transporter permease [Firmicutes bacterium]|nr:ABC transporter permease [Bacillota bacterium]
MFFHNLKYTLKTIFKNKLLIFWTFAFPIILGLFFNMAFSDIESDEKLKVFDIAVVNNENFKNNTLYKEIIEELSSGKDKVFNVKYTSLEDSENLLKDDKIEGYLNFKSDTPNIIVKKSGINQTILKSVIEEIEIRKNVLNDVVEKQVKIEIESGNYDINTEEIVNNILIRIDDEVVKFNNKSNSNLSYMTIEYYTLIAMACMYSAMIGLTAINQSLPNMGSIGKRSSITPTKKSVIVLSKAIGSYIISTLGIALLILFLKFLLKIDFGSKMLYVVILALTGSLAGTSMGILISSIIKAKEGTKVGITIAVSMFLSVLSGMMGVTLKYVIDKNVPIVNLINPNNMITDGFYTLYYYDTLNRYWMNIASLIIFSFICLLISLISIRRDKYDSI